MNNNTSTVVQTYPLPSIERFPRNIHSTAIGYTRMDGMRYIHHPLIADHNSKIPLMMGSMTADAHTVWSILKRANSRYKYGRVKWRRPESQRNLS
jgi:hypothetical protein